MTRPAGHPPLDPAPESLDIEPEMAVKNGYTESKWVAEQLLGRAAEERALQTTVVRVGQLSGHSHTGSWNTAEMVPAFVRLCQRLGCVPTRHEVCMQDPPRLEAWFAHGAPQGASCTYVPVDIAAAALLEMVTCGSDERVLHITSPRPASWNEVYGFVAHQNFPKMLSVLRQRPQRRQHSSARQQLSADKRRNARTQPSHSCPHTH